MKIDEYTWPVSGDACVLFTLESLLRGVARFLVGDHEGAREDWSAARNQRKWIHAQERLYRRECTE